ncbi:type II toxin-antitoxin system prevent-host-death family antitoxin [Acidobacteria bacterium AH-259-L09]|nr:type II toxin-antitoxin system prevent-host-death family antitoxin [Acidobacteria bacterium AH-259-L09]
MKRISIRELHMNTERWVRKAAEQEEIVVTDRGTPVVTLAPYDRSKGGKPLPNRWNQIKRMPKIPVDSAVYVSEMRNRS